MLEKGIDISVIMEITGLSEEEITGQIDFATY